MPHSFAAGLEPNRSSHSRPRRLAPRPGNQRESVRASANRAGNETLPELFDVGQVCLFVAGHVVDLAENRDSAELRVPTGSPQVAQRQRLGNHSSFLFRLPSLVYLRLQTPYAHLVAHASTFQNGPCRTRRTAGCERATRRARDRGVAVAPASSRHARPPARDRSRATDRSRAVRLEGTRSP
jgi:hypothetical protein